MTAFLEWQQFAAVQRRPHTGCIPTGYEMLLKAAGATGINYSTFQDDFDFDCKLAPGSAPVNHFGIIARAVEAKYPSVKFGYSDFPSGQGAAKLTFVEQRFLAGQPSLISVTIKPQGGWHITPVVGLDDKNLMLLWVVHQNDIAEIMKMPKTDFVMRHDSWPGGSEVAYLEKWM